MSAPVNGRPPEPCPTPACWAGDTAGEPDDWVWPLGSVPGTTEVVLCVPGTTGVEPGEPGVEPGEPGVEPGEPGVEPGEHPV